MKRFILPAAILAALSAPAAALAAPATQRATVLSVDAAQHTLQVVGSDHRVHAYGYRGGARLRPGSVITFRRRGGVLSWVHVDGLMLDLSYRARVVSSTSRGVVLRLADGHRLSMRAGATRVAIAHAAAAGPSLTVPSAGLRAGETVLVTELLASDGSVIALSVDPSAA